MPKVDVFIPEYNRPVFLKRLLSYLGPNSKGLRILVIDSGTVMNKRANRKTIRGLGYKNIKHIVFPTKIHPHIKFGKMLKHAKSKYVAFCANDDFIIPAAVLECVKFLEKNNDYSSAHGTYLSFYVTKNKKFLWKFIYPYKSIIDTDPATRLKKHLTNYYQVLWSVRRTKDAKEAYSTLLKERPNPYLFGELMPDMATLILGKMKRLPIMYSFRQSFSSFGGNWPTLYDAMHKGYYDLEFTKFKKGLSDLLVKHSNKTQEQVHALIDKYMQTYLNNYSPEHYVLHAYRFLKKLPSFISNFVAQLHIRYLYMKDKKDPIGKINPLKGKFANDFNAIKKTVLSSEFSN